MSRLAWTDPAPLEVERLRLPWWTMLPRKVLLLASPIILTAALVVVVVFVSRKLYRYPLAHLLAALGVAAYCWDGWPPVAGLAGLVLLIGVLYWWRPDPWVSRALTRQARSEYRRATVYVPGWRKTVKFSELTKQYRREVHYPRIRKVRCDGWRDRVSVKMLRGQCPDDYAQATDRLAHSFGARACRVRVERPRRIALDFLHTDPLAIPFRPPALAADDATGIDLRRVLVGRSETGRDWRLRLLGSHVLAAGVTGAGKASVAWSLIWSLAPLIRVGAVQVFGIDPKGGMELGKCPAPFQKLIYSNGADAVELLEHLATLTRQRSAALRSRLRSWTAESGQPFVLLIVDELADVIAYQPDRKLRERANLALQVITSQGRAPGVAVLGELQDPRKEILSFRHLFPTRLALRLDEPGQVDMVLGDGVRECGAEAHEISEDTPGVAWVKVDGRREPDRVRAFHVTDTDLDELTDYLTAGRPAVPRQLPGQEAA